MKKVTKYRRGVHLQRVLKTFVAVIAMGLVMVLAGCSGDDGATGAPGAPGGVTNETCLAANCHGNTALVKTIVRNDAGKEGVEETIPLYVDKNLYAATVHGGKLCVGCHTDINAAGGAHGPVAKTYGGWARFSAKQAVETIATNEILRTRNYITAASRSCATCHSNHTDFANSAHATIYKMRDAKIDADLKAAAEVQFPLDTVGDLGENYMAGDCNRCHAACSTCHFKSVISRAVAGNPLDWWDRVQANDDATPDEVKMTEFSMDWTTNVASHEFRKGSYFENDTELVCEACHTGYYRPAKVAYNWANAEKTSVLRVKASNGRRHMQTYELMISGIGSNNSAHVTGGDNTAHANMACVDCHKGLHALPGISYDWDAKGDVQCIDCHGTYTHTNAAVNLHSTTVACVGCHSFGMARDFMYKSGAPVDDSTDVFVDPESGLVRPVIFKHGLAEAWYPHNWQTLNPGAGKLDPDGDCAKKCHYTGNQVGAL